MTDPQENAPIGPYAHAAPIYWRSGWAPLPLPAGQKQPVPKGWTGRDGAYPSFPDVQAWTEDRAASNIALRLPPNIVGVDVDHYDAKPGGTILAALETQLGALPPTWRTTSRDDGISGIRLYRIPEGLRWPGILGPGIETIRYDHRYAVTWPSTHPNGGTYRWITPQGATALEQVPHADDLPDLPTSWVEHFTRGELATDQPRIDMHTGQVGDWLNARGQGAPCRHMDRAITRGHQDLQAAQGARHDAALSVVNRIVWLTGEGHTGGLTALTTIRDTFLRAVAGDRDLAEAQAELGRMVEGAVRISAAAHPNTPDVDPCVDPFAGLIPKGTRPSAPPAATPTGNGSTPSSNPAPSPTSSSAASTADTSSTSPSPTEDTSHRTTWWPHNLDAVLDGSNIEPPPEFLHRTDGQALLYAGKINGIIGPSESGKTWVALTAVVQAVRDGQRTTILDFEDTDTSVINRLVLLGLTPTQVRDHVAYIGPDEALHAVAAEDLQEHLDGWQPALVVLDGFNAAMTLHGYDLMSNKDATSFFQLVLRRLVKGGAAVVYVDHTPKDKTNESSGGIGAQAKRAMTDGTILRASIVKEFGKGQKGTVRLFVDKDRHGHVRGAATPFKVGERNLHWVAEMTLTPSPDDTVTAELQSPQEAAEGRGTFRPTVLMERVSSWLAANPGSGRNEVLREVTGRKEHVATALRILIDEDWVAAERNGQKHLYSVAKHYSEAAELASDTPNNNRGPTGVQPGSRSPVEQLGSPGSTGQDVVLATREPSATSEPTPNQTPGSRTRPRVIINGELIDIETGEILTRQREDQP